MRSSIIPLNSYTAAKRAARYLSSMGIRASVEKISSGRNGCMFGIRTNEDPVRVCRMLADIGISCADRMPVPPPPPPPPPPPHGGFPRPPHGGHRH